MSPDSQGEQEKTFSRLEINIDKNTQLPITVLKSPETLPGGQEERGVIICGDSVVDDLVKLMPDIKDKWFVISTTQSHIIPASPNPDLHLFSNCDGNEEYLAGTAREVPFRNTGDGGDFVNPEIFYPNPQVPKIIDAVYVAKWADTKRVELFVQAAEVLPGRTFVLVAIPVSSERKRQKSFEYRDTLLRYIDKNGISNIEVVEPGEESHTNIDGSLVPGKLSKDEMRALYQSARSVILTARLAEGSNRSVAECLCCDVPVVMTNDLIGGTRHVVNEQTGVLVEPTGQGVADGIEQVIRDASRYHPRDNFLQNRGIINANREVQEAVTQISKAEGRPIEATKMRSYGGDLWSNDFYLKVAPVTIRERFLKSK